MNVDAYIKSANRGDFQWYPLETDNFTGQIVHESCTYKGEGIDVNIIGTKGEYDIEIDGLTHEPFYLFDTRASRKSAREYAERIIKNDRNGDWKKNLKYVNY